MNFRHIQMKVGSRQQRRVIRELTRTLDIGRSEPIWPDRPAHHGRQRYNGPNTFLPDFRHIPTGRKSKPTIGKYRLMWSSCLGSFISVTFTVSQRAARRKTMTDWNRSGVRWHNFTSPDPLPYVSTCQRGRGNSWRPQPPAWLTPRLLIDISTISLCARILPAPSRTGIDVWNHCTT